MRLCLTKNAINTFDETRFNVIAQIIVLGNVLNRPYHFIIAP